MRNQPSRQIDRLQDDGEKVVGDGEWRRKWRRNRLMSDEAVWLCGCGELGIPLFLSVFLEKMTKNYHICAECVS
jgi:hypothetical protein